LPPLTFHEYIHLKEYNHLISAQPNFIPLLQATLYSTEYINELNELFLDYINFGGYPEVIFSDQIRADLRRYLKSDIIDKVLLRDLPSLYGIQNVQELNTFFTMLTYYCGNEVSLDGLSTSSGINKPTLKKYIDYLEAAFLIKSIDRVDDCAKKFKRQNFYKIYLTNPSLRSALFSPLTENDEALPHMVETAIFAQWMHNIEFKPWYARWNGGEVDIVGLRNDNLKPFWAVEIKWSNAGYNDPWKELKSLFQFCKKNNMKSAIVTTLDITDVRTVNDIMIQYVPSSVYAYTLGRNIVDYRKPSNSSSFFSWYYTLDKL
jgi:predicted AAA+ superfamily ATPase